VHGLIPASARAGLDLSFDRGSQDCSHEFKQTLAGYEMEIVNEPQGRLLGQFAHRDPMGRLKVGRLYGRRFATRREAMDEVMDWINF
jgi:putative transposase